MHSGRTERSRLHCRQKFLVSLQRAEETLMTNEWYIKCCCDSHSVWRVTEFNYTLLSSLSSLSDIAHINT